MLVRIFFLCRHSAPDVPLGFIDIQYLSGLRRERRIDLQEPLGHVLMYRTLTNAELLRRLPHSRIVLDNIAGNPHCPLLNIILQRKSPITYFLHHMLGGFYLYIENLLSAM